MKSYLKTQLFDRIRQFGAKAAIFQIVCAALRWVYKVEQYIIFIIPDFEGCTFDDPCIVPFTLERIKCAAASGDFDTRQVSLLEGFIEEGSKGICYEFNGRLAGYGWIQFEGVYRFGHSGKMTIPPKYAIAKNLLILPEYRGCRLGQKLNAARLGIMLSDYTPVGFIIPENRKAIRNWEKYGFRRMLEVKRCCWIGGLWKMGLTRLSDRPEAIVLEKALRESNE